MRADKEGSFVARERYRAEGPVVPPPAPERRIAAVLEAGWEAMSFGRWRMPGAEPPWESVTGMERGWIVGGEWPEASIGSVRGGKAGGLVRGAGVVGFEGMGDEVVRSVVGILVVLVLVFGAAEVGFAWVVMAGRCFLNLVKLGSLLVINRCSRFIDGRLEGRTVNSYQSIEVT